MKPERPKRNFELSLPRHNGKPHSLFTEIHNYILNLESYCDEQERAYDDACDMLAILGASAHYRFMSKDEWKEWWFIDGNDADEIERFMK